MAEWPVKVKETLEEVERGVVEPGGEVAATWATISGKPKAAIWIICPRCGTLGHCPADTPGHEDAAWRNKGGWEIAEGEFGLTMRPSILCNSNVGVSATGERLELGRECDGHYWLTAGVLKEV